MDRPQLLLENQLCFPMYSVSRLITQAYKPYLDNLGLTYPQYLVMLVLWENDEVSVNHITQKLLLNTNTVSPLLKRMEKQGLVERRRSKEDERAVIVKLTKKGKSMHDAAAQIPHQLMEEVSSGDMSTEEVNNLKTTLCKWMDILSKR
ncbi:MAG: DNA-binding MarR family transcriptional regulator [Marivirga sp.]|jgi:DNA-binding MarR family transcriptional regulator